MTRTASILVACGVALGCSGDAGPTRTEILWDTWGVPHIYAATDAEVFRAFGYAQMAAHGNLVLRLYGEARGRAAEYWGEAGLANDRFVRTMGIPARAAAWYQATDPAYRELLNAFAMGVNQYAQEHPDRIADSVRSVLPVSASDVIAHGQKVVQYLFMFFGQVEVPETMNNDDRPGSNMWAIGPRRSASGNALLLGNPHLPWNGLYLFFEAHQVTPDRNLYGTALVGMPNLAIGFNEHVGWSHTVNTQDGADVFRLTKRGNGYLFDGSEQPFIARIEEIRVRLPDGTIRSDTLIVKESVHGPVLREDARTALAVRVAGLDDANASEQWWRMGGARSVAEFESIVREIHIPFFNVMAAGTDGDIFYFFGGKTPRRTRGGFADWTGPVPGDSSALVWNETLGYDELPHVTNPRTGWLQNANDPPWTVTWPAAFDPGKFPTYLAPHEMGFRPQQSSLLQMADTSVTFEELVAYKHSTRMLLADRMLPDLLAEARRRGDGDARRAADVLEQWDRSAEATSRGAVLFQRWAMTWLRAGGARAFARPWRLDSALTTPAGLGDPAAAVAALSAAARDTEKEHGSLDVPWGEVMRIRYGGRDLPGNGAPGDPLGVFRVASYAPEADGKYRLLAGDTYYQVVEFSKPVRAKVLLAYGNATQPGSKHVGDQLDLFAAKSMRDAWTSRADVEAHLELREALDSLTAPKGEARPAGR